MEGLNAEFLFVIDSWITLGNDRSFEFIYKLLTFPELFDSVFPFGQI